MPSHRDPERSHPTAEQTLAATAAQAVRLREQVLADLASLDAASFQDVPQQAAGRELLAGLRGAIDQLLEHVERVDEPCAQGGCETSPHVADTMQADLGLSLPRRLEEES